MKIIKYEQSGFIIETSKGTKLAIDIATKTPLEKLKDISVDMMIVSHMHGDHFSEEHIKVLKPSKLYLNQECIDTLDLKELNSDIEVIQDRSVLTINGIKIEVFTVNHGPNIGELKENYGFLITCDNKKVYFAGDMYYESGIDITNLKVDYALIPVGGYYTFGPQEAFDFIKKFKEIGEIIPMHYERNANIDPIRNNEFIDLAKKDFFINTEANPEINN